MPPDPTPTSHATAERRPAVWPWLLIPLVALTIYYVLHTAKESPQRQAGQHVESSETAAPSEVAESP